MKAKTSFPFTVSFFHIFAASCSFLFSGEATRAVVHVHLSYDTPFICLYKSPPVTFVSELLLQSVGMHMLGEV